MIAEKSKELLEESEKLKKENKELQQQLREAQETIDQIKTGNIDALVVGDKKDLKIYTEKTADKTYRILIEKMHEGAVTLNKDGTILYCNSYFANMVSLPLQKVIGLPLTNFVEDSSKVRFEAFLKQGWEKAVKEEGYIYTNKGKTIPVLMSLTTISLDNNIFLSAILTDLTAQYENQEKLKSRTKQLEQKNKELESANMDMAFQDEHIGNLAAIVQSSENAIISESMDGTIKSWNKGAEKMFGYTAKEAVGKNISLIIPPEYISEGKKIREKILNNEIIEQYETLRNKKSGEQFYVSLIVSPMKDLAGKITGISKIARDVTSQKISEAVLIQTNKKLAFQIEQKEKRTAELGVAKADVNELEALNTHKESILATLSHDLRSPLTGIIGTAEHLKESFDKMDSGKVKELLDLLYKASTDELNMLDNLVEWARIKYASEAFSPSKIELALYVKKVFNILKETAAQNEINLHNEVDENTPVFADEKMLLSILQNLVSNAIKYSHKGGSITITAKRKEDKVIVEVKDTGSGMSKEIREKLFTPQMKSLSKAREDNKGAGIGLLLVKNFLERNGGEIWVESVEGEGSSFYFTLPVNKPLDQTESANKTELAESH
jgi:two-component system CheB/CheR fusion protein